MLLGLLLLFAGLVLLGGGILLVGYCSGSSGAAVLWSSLGLMGAFLVFLGVLTIRAGLRR